MKKLLGCLCALLILAGLAVPLAASGAGAPPEDGPIAPPAPPTATETNLAPAADPITVTGAMLEKGQRLFLYEKGAPVESLTEQLDTLAYLLPLRRPFATGTIVWDTAGCNLATTGRKTLRGRVELPETHVYLVNGQPAELWVEAAVMVYQAGMPPSETVTPNSVDIFGPRLLVPLGSSGECLNHFMAEADYLATAKTADGLFIHCRASFHPSLVDLNKVGWYYGFVYDLPSCFSLAQDDPWDADVVVLRDDIVDLTYTRTGQVYVSSQWLYAAYEPTLWVARDVDPEELEDPAVWAQVPEIGETGGRLYSFSETLPEGSSESMEIPLHYFSNASGNAYEPGTYYFQVRHRDGVSNITSVKVSEGEFVVEVPGGDKDGGDAGDEDPPSTEQPPPGSDGPKNTGSTTPAENTGDTAAKAGTGGMASGMAGATLSSDDASNGMERSTPTETTVSGLRLRELMALQGEWVLFQKKGFSVRFSAAFLETLALADQDLFTVTLEVLDGHRYHIGAAVNGAALSSIPGTLVELWYNGPAGLQMVDEQGGELPDVVYNETQSLVTFTVDATGIYTLLEAAAAGPTPVQAAIDAVGAGENSLPGWGVALAVCGVGLPAAGMAGGLWHRRAKARRGK